MFLRNYSTFKQLTLFVHLDDDLVKYLICQTRVKYLKLNEHIVRTRLRVTRAAVKSLLLGGKQVTVMTNIHNQFKPVLHSKTEIKEMLQYDLPVNGNKAIWEQRHQRCMCLSPCLVSDLSFQDFGPIIG